MRVLPLLVVALACVAVASAGAIENNSSNNLFALDHLDAEQLSVSDVAAMFKTFIARFKKAYSTSSFAAKLSRFTSNVKKILNLNKENNGAKFGVTEAADLSTAEFQAKYMGAKPLAGDSTKTLSLLEAETGMFADIEDASASEMTAEQLNSEFAAGFDWRKKNVLAAPRHQHECGSCYAFASAATVEAAIAIKKGAKGPYLAPQMAVDCCAGCVGSVVTCPYIVYRDQGYFLESAYPYKNKQNPTCPPKSGGSIKPAGKISNAVKTAPAAAAFVKHLKTNPLLLHVNADPIQFYQSGIYKGPATPTVNHAVVLVAYGQEKGQNYFTIRNSWGSDWGEQGHFRVSADGNPLSVFKYGGFMPQL